MPKVGKYGQDVYEVGGRLREERMEAGFSQEKLGELIETDGNTISRYELGAREMGIHVFFQLADVLHIKPDQLLPERYHSEKETEDDRREQNELISIFSGLSHENRELLLGMAKLMQSQSNKVNG